RRRWQRFEVAGRVRGAGARRHGALCEDRQGERAEDRLGAGFFSKMGSRCRGNDDLRSFDMKLIPSGESLGARIEGLDLARPLQPAELQGVLQALGKYGVVRSPRPERSGKQLRVFSSPAWDPAVRDVSE